MTSTYGDLSYSKKKEFLVPLHNQNYRQIEAQVESHVVEWSHIFEVSCDNKMDKDP